MRITVLGGCGAVGSIAVKTLASSDVFSKIVIGDMDVQKAKKLAFELGAERVSAIKVDASDPDSIKEAIKGSSVVLNCIGPFYEFGPRVLKATIESGINYVDICDDFDATEKILAMDEDAKKAGISALIGMGSSPGVANVLVRFCAETLLDEIESIDIYHAHGGEEVEGPAVVKHRIHSMMIEVPMFLDGKFTTVNLFEESGKALEEEVDFADVGKYRVYAYPHPETITLPKYIKGVKRVTNLGLVLPPAYAELIKGVVRLGITSEEPIDVKGQKISPLEFAVAYILSQRERLVKEAGITEPMGCLKIVVKGRKKGESSTYVFSMSSRGKGMGEGTGIPAALVAMLMGQGKITEKGVFPPEAGVKPMDLVEIAQEKVKIGGKAGMPIVIEHIDKDGNVERMS
ncbi:saccharopine dehydrogenase NADP-binding domain-containing protein, partial [Candidatus Bathyarchaeota archaeon]|nr:saccharopine dehydrogenase NADP-binding domain-containing protein [Candidatus Bathyarchaeota archaeon]